MKRLLFILILFSFNLKGFTQANVTSTAISIQGIARSSTNNALTNQTNYPIVITIFTGSGTNEKTLITQNATVNTDDFGVFSYNLTISSSDFTTISNNDCWIRIANNGSAFVQEKLKSVPYALQAQNGVPTGAIMAFLGTVAPNGWMLADGSAIPQNDPVYAALKTIYGTNVPNLKGLFLRGTGTNGTNSTYVGPSLNAVQNDDFNSHTHTFTMSGTTSNDGSHSHDARYYTGYSSGTRIDSHANPFKAYDSPNTDGSAQAVTSTAGSHSHTLSINVTASITTAPSETRPANWGVNYIIKI